MDTKKILISVLSFILFFYFCMWAVLYETKLLEQEQKDEIERKEIQYVLDSVLRERAMHIKNTWMMMNKGKG